MLVLTYYMYRPSSFTLRDEDDWLSFFVDAMEHDFLGACYGNKLYRDGVLIARQAIYQGVG